MQDLINDCIKGNRKAQQELYQQYAKAMYNTCYRIMNNAEEAEDILQEAFVSAFRNLASFKYESTFGAWLKRIVVNHAINSLRKRKLQLISMSETNIDYEDHKYTEDRGNQTLSVAKIKKAMKELPEGYRVVFSLYLIEGYDHKEISKILGITESTSKSQLNRAKSKLRALMA